MTAAFCLIWLWLVVSISLSLVPEHRSRVVQRRAVRVYTEVKKDQIKVAKWPQVQFFNEASEGFPPPAGLGGELPKIGGIQKKMPESVEGEFISADSDLRRLDRRIVIVTTAALPWMTGTAVNPALRAAYLAARGYDRVMLMLPWLESREEQSKLFGEKRYFENPQDQARFIHDWCRQNAPIKNEHKDFEIGWYPARYAENIGSILGVDDIISHIPDEIRDDVVILEEPEHINWYRNGPRWTSVFKHVVGVAHTNYEAYTTTATDSRDGRSLSIDALAERLFTETVTRAHCDVVIQLSATLRPLPHSRVCNVHGVREQFLKVGDEATRKRKRSQNAKASATNILDNVNCYFLGKALWAKGYDQLLLILSINPKLCKSIRLDCYGDGPDLESITQKAQAIHADGLEFKGRADHGDASVFGKYDIFVNPSISEVLCTATAEALAMGKVVVIARHPSNEFFYQFDTCHAFIPGDDNDFKECLETAARQILHREYTNPEQRRDLLTWEAATDRLLESSALDLRVPPARLALASLVMHSYHWGMTASPIALDLWLTISGAGPHTPWSSRYPAAFRALNTTESALKHASKQLNKASDRLRRGDELAFRLARRHAARRRDLSENVRKMRPGKLKRLFARSGSATVINNTTALFPPADPQFYQANPFRHRLTKMLRGRSATSSTTTSTKSWLAPLAPRNTIPKKRPKSSRKSTRLPKDLAERTARAAEQLRSDILSRDGRRRSPSNSIPSSFASSKPNKSNDSNSD